MPAGSRPWLRRALAIVVLTAGLLTLLSANASAHAKLLETNPANGAHLDEPPARVTLRFTEAVQPVRDGFSLLDENGRTISRPAATADDATVSIPLPRLDDGVFVVNWRVVSTDSHPIFSTFVFSVGDARAAPLTDAGAQSGSVGLIAPAFWTARLLSFASLALLIGGMFFLLVCWPAGRADQRVRRLLRVAWVTAVVTAAATLLLQGPNVAGRPLSEVTDLALLSDTVQSSFGLLLLVRLALLGLAVFLLPRLKPLSGKHLAVVLGLGYVLAVTWSGTGHAASGRLSLLAMATDALHLTAACVWLGGLTLLSACLLRGTPDRDDEGVMVTAVTRFSRTAAASVAVLGTTGIAQALLKLNEFGAGSEYLSLLVFKVAVFGLLLWVASLSRSFVNNRLLAKVGTAPVRGRRKEQRTTLSALRRSAGWEAGVAVVVLGLTAALVSVPPGGHDHGPAAVAAAPTGPFLEAIEFPNGDVQIWVAPARTGKNQIVLNVRDDRGINQDIPEVSADLRLAEGDLGPLPVPLSKTGTGQFVADDVMVPVAGDWKLTLRVRRTEFDTSAMDVSIPMR
jgi:copper transport protein